MLSFVAVCMTWLVSQCGVAGIRQRLDSWATLQVAQATKLDANRSILHNHVLSSVIDASPALESCSSVDGCASKCMCSWPRQCYKKVSGNVNIGTCDFSIHTQMFLSVVLLASCLACVGAIRRRVEDQEMLEAQQALRTSTTMEASEARLKDRLRRARTSREAERRSSWASSREDDQDELPPPTVVTLVKWPQSDTDPEVTP